MKRFLAWSLFAILTASGAASAVTDDVLTSSGDGVAQKIDDIQVTIDNDGQLPVEQIGVNGTFGGQNFPLPMRLTNTEWNCADGWFYQGGQCKQVIVEETQAIRDRGYTCPDGYTLNGDSCYKLTTQTQAATGGPFDYYDCPTGYTLNGTTCEADNQASQTYNEVWTCPDGWNLNGTNCERTLTEPATWNDVYSCPTGYTLSGTTCSKFESQGATYNSLYSCEAGWTLNGTNCDRTLTQSATDAGYYSCSSGWTLNGSNCERTLTQPATDEGYYSCPAGYTLSGSNCSKNESQAASSNTTYSCPSGYSLSGTTCSKTDSTAANNTITYSCPSSYTMVQVGEPIKWENSNPTHYATKRSCYLYKTGTSGEDGTFEYWAGYANPISNNNYSCNSGWTLSGSTCYKTTNISATANTTYSCSSGWTLSGTTCSRTLNQSATWNNVYTCPTGYSLSGTTCSKDETASASWNTVYTCPTGYSLSGTTCSKDETQAASDDSYYSCTSGWNLSGSNCERTLTQTADNNGYYSCQVDYTLSGSNCSKDEQNGATDESYYSCPAGYVMNGSNCEYSATVSANLIEDYSCPAGYSLSGTDCLKEESQPAAATNSCSMPYPNDSGTQCQVDSIAPVADACPDPNYSHYVYAGQGQYLCYSAAVDPADSTTQFTPYTVSYSCASGWTLNGQVCERTLTVGSTYSSHYECPGSGWTLSGTTCTMDQPATVSADHHVGDNYSCGTGWTLNTDTCSKDVYNTQSANLDWLAWRCESGSLVNTDQCRESWIQAVTAVAKSWELQADYDLISDDDLRVAMVAAYLAGDSFTIGIVEGASTSHSETLNYSGVVTAGVTSSGNVGSAGSTPDTVYIPAIAEEVFQRSSGDEVFLITEMKDINGSAVTGTHDVFVQLDASASGGVLINGSVINPGETVRVEQNRDLDADPKINYRMAATTAAVGSYSLTVTTSAYDTRPVRYHVSAWQPAVAEAITNTTPLQLLDTLTLNIDKASRCRLTQDAASAENVSAVSDPICLIEWTNIPSGLTELNKAGVGNRVTLQGYLNTLGSQSAQYSLSIYNGETKIPLSTGSVDLDALSPVDGITLEVPTTERTTRALISNADIALQQSAGTVCNLTTDAAAAMIAADERTYQGRPTCLVEWTTLPSGLAQVSFDKQPWLQGVTDTVGTSPIAWTLSVYNGLGEKVLIGNQSNDLVVEAPDTPTIEMVTRYALDETTLIVPLGETNASTAKIDANNADLTYEIYRDNVLIQSEEVLGGWSTSNLRFYRYLQIEESKGLWSKTPMRIKVFYSRAPEISAESSVNIFVEPPLNIRPTTTLKDNPSQEVLNSDLFTVESVIGNYYNQSEPYQPSTMGEWDMRLVQQSGSQITPLTDWESAAGGTGEQQFYASAFDGQNSVRIITQARLKVPAELSSYERIEQTSRALYVTILNGDAIDSTADARKLSGKAPFTAIVRLRVDDYDLLRSLGTVTWQVSSDNGATWTDTLKDDSSKTSFTQTFPTGIYHLRAKTINLNSGAESVTPTIELNSYETVELAVVGPQVKFIGENALYQAQVTLNELPATHGDDVVVEWSTDRGDTYFQSPLGASLDIDGSVAGRTYVWVRARTTQAPADDPYAYTELKRSVEFRPVKPPRVYVFGPTTAEKGKEYKYTARATLPYTGMDSTIDGHFTLPDGTEVSGNEVTFIPDDADVAAVRREILYTSWIVGWENLGGKGTYGRSVRVWEYIFPTFALTYTKDAGVVPANLNISMRPVGFTGTLDTAVYDWTLPAGAEVTYDSVDYARGVKVTDAGLHTVSVKVTDARGNEVTKSLNINLGVPAPYVLNLSTTMSNNLNREPLDINLRPYVTGGHPRDRIISYAYRLNGEAHGTGSQYASLNDAMEGAYSFELQITSQMGESVSDTAEVSVIDNVPPTCSTRFRETIGSYIVYAECEDSDGRIRRYEWVYGGETRTVTSDRITISKTSDTELFEVKVSGIDDSDEKSEQATITIDPSVSTL